MTKRRTKNQAPSALKIPLGINVLQAAKERIAYVFDRFQRIYVSFSGGKDSTVLLHLVMDEAIRRGRRVGLLFIDWEAQMNLTINHVRECYELYGDHIDPLWFAVPLKTTNACSMLEPEWICWEPSKRELWVRELPPEANFTAGNAPAFYREAMTFEEFVDEFGDWYGAGDRVVGLVGIRSDESLNRFRTLRMKKARFEGRPWTTKVGRNSYNAYPIYDWRTEDDWTYLGKTGQCYNRLYDRMHQAGLSLHQMRICEPYGDEQRRGLWLYHLVEPETWAKVVGRVSGANQASLYGEESGNILGNRSISLPDGHSWKSFAYFLLDTMPPATAEHYRNKIAVYLEYCIRKIGYEGDIPDFKPGDTGAKDIPSWRRICKVLLKNDYWCKALSFSPTKAAAYEAYRELMKKRREKWRLI